MWRVPTDNADVKIKQVPICLPQLRSALAVRDARVSWRWRVFHTMGRKRCSHGNEKCKCAACNPCPHGKVKQNCVECNGCPHGKLKKDCAACNPCPHGKVKGNCAKCNQCPHGKRKLSARRVTPALPAWQGDRPTREVHPLPSREGEIQCAECKAGN